MDAPHKPIQLAVTFDVWYLLYFFRIYLFSSNKI